MLKGLDPLLSADLLHALRAMGHGDVIVLVDANFPARSVARTTTMGTALSVAASLPSVARSILSVLPLDTFEPGAVRRMEVVGAPLDVPAVQREVLALVEDAAAENNDVRGYDRHAFYDMAGGAFVIVQTAERRLYGCMAFVKGVIGGPDGGTTS